MRNEVDLAVHSMKDVPTDLPSGLALSAFLEREDPSEAFVSHIAATIAELPRGARFGTSSVRRHAQVARQRPDLEIVLLRGNVDTRLRKLDDGEMDAILLAYAGLKRLGLQDRATAVLPTSVWLPSLGQGVIGSRSRPTPGARNSPLNLPSEIALIRTRSRQLDGSCRRLLLACNRLRRHAQFRGGCRPWPRRCCNQTDERAFDTRANNVENVGRERGVPLKPQAAKWLSL